MSKMDFQPMVESRPIREIAYEVLKHAIVSGEIPAGERIIETDYAAKLHISRTPLREALRKLERDGLVEYVMRRGVVVRAFTINDVEEIYTIRNTLELLVMPAVIRNASPADIADLRAQLRAMDGAVQSKDFETLSPLARAFHRDLINISNQQRILRVIESQEEYINRFSSMAIHQEPELEKAHMEHYQLVDLVEKRDEAALVDLLERHIDRSKAACIEALLLQQKDMKMD